MLCLFLIERDAADCDKYISTYLMEMKLLVFFFALFFAISTSKKILYSANTHLNVSDVQSVSFYLHS